MIDEHEEIRKYIRDNDNRIEELEKKMELERKIKIWDTKVINKMNKEIAELKEEYEEITNKYRYFEDMISGGMECIHDRWLIKEVLRELINNILLIKSKSPSESYDFLVGLLVKLDSGGEKASIVETGQKTIDGKTGGNPPSDSKPPEPALEEKFIKTISNPKLHWYYKTPKGEGFLDEPKEDDFILDKLTKRDKRFISEFLRDLNELGNNEHWIVPPLNNLMMKWEDRLK